jgi:molecular chaperone GrpE
MLILLAMPDHHDPDPVPEPVPVPEPEQPGEPQEPKRSGFTVTDRRFWAQGEDGGQAEPEKPRLPSYVEQLKHQVEEKDKQLREYIAAYKREVVEGLEKTKQRLERDASQQKERERGELARPLMDVLDALERSLASAETARDLKPVVEGLRMVHLLMVQKLGELGLSRIETSGRPFDPAVHEAAAVVPVSDPALDRMVTAELRPGFLHGERVVRPALVQVGRLQS